MLVLSRKQNECIVINDKITIAVVEIRGDKVRLGIEAPKEMPVHRREVFDAIRRNEGVIDRPDAEYERHRQRLEQIEAEVCDPVLFNSMLDEVTGKELSDAEADYIARGAARALVSSLRSTAATSTEELSDAEADSIARGAARALVSSLHSAAATRAASGSRLTEARRRRWASLYHAIRDVLCWLVGRSGHRRG
jgi:carbon storage regulator